mmetsp:Transcript_17116/g.34835  ORF Transcript_17116/g.34835 Transcript_17116/m.34835 type:complete len:342 (+) Transcript_17116:83-1108(+)
MIKRSLQSSPLYLDLARDNVEGGEDEKVDEEVTLLAEIARFSECIFKRHLSQVLWRGSNLVDAKSWLRSVKKLQIGPCPLSSEGKIHIPEDPAPEFSSCDESEAETEIEDGTNSDHDEDPLDLIRYDVVDVEATGTVEDGEDEQEDEEEEEDDDDPCEICQLDRNRHKQLECDECKKGFHLYCLDPPLETLPVEDEWFCPGCEVYLKAVHNRDERRTGVINDMKAKHAAGIKEKREVNDAIRLRNAERHSRRVDYVQRTGNIACLKIEEAKQRQARNASLEAWDFNFKAMLKASGTLLKRVKTCIESQVEEEGGEDDDEVYEGPIKRRRPLFGENSGLYKN